MEIIINIPDITYNETLERKQLAICNDNDIYEWIKNGIPLDEIRAEAISRKINYTDSNRDTYRRGINDVLKIINEIMDDESEDGEVYEKIKEIITNVKEMEK